MSTIFGEKHFIDPEMILMSQRVEYEKQLKKELVGDVYKATIKYGFEVNKEKLKKWLELCAKLEKIEYSDLIDIATQKRFADVKEAADKKLDEYKRAIQLMAKELANTLEERGECACRICSANDQNDYGSCGACCRAWDGKLEEDLIPEYFLKKAREENNK